MKIIRWNFKKVGVDLTGPKQIEEALDVFEKLLNEWDGQA